MLTESFYRVLDPESYMPPVAPFSSELPHHNSGVYGTSGSYAAPCMISRWDWQLHPQDFSCVVFCVRFFVWVRSPRCCSELSASDEDSTWISWFVTLRGNEFFCEVSTPAGSFGGNLIVTYGLPRRCDTQVVH